MSLHSPWQHLLLNRPSKHGSSSHSRLCTYSLLFTGQSLHVHKPGLQITRRAHQLSLGRLNVLTQQAWFKTFCRSQLWEWENPPTYSIFHLIFFLSQAVNAGCIIKGKFVGQAEANFHGGLREIWSLLIKQEDSFSSCGDDSSCAWYWGEWKYLHQAKKQKKRVEE